MNKLFITIQNEDGEVIELNAEEMKELYEELKGIFKEEDKITYVPYYPNYPNYPYYEDPYYPYRQTHYRIWATNTGTTFDIKKEKKEY